ncbi:DUF2637 domain-containing protein [Nocardiopsis sediminis]|uniref:DUF2637 domain-containing protein n=1 Tax=Nocardiopsis sediminis TaxID=1778267 RepID=A0ABV8FVF1_9ACTN
MAVESSSKTPGARRVPDPPEPGGRPGFAAIALTGLGVVVIAACAVLLSYNGIYQIARQGGVDARSAHLYPGGFTLLLLMAFWTGYVLRAAPRSRRLWVDALILAMILLAAGASALETTGQRLLPQVAVVLTAVAPWVALLAAFRIFLWVWMHARGEFPDERAERNRRARPRAPRPEPGPDDPTDVLDPVPAAADDPGEGEGAGDGREDRRGGDDVTDTARLAPVPPPADDRERPARRRGRGPAPLWPRPQDARRGGAEPPVRVLEEDELRHHRSRRPEPPEPDEATASPAPRVPAEPPMPAEREPADLTDPDPGTPPSGSRLPDTPEPLPSAAADRPAATAADARATGTEDHTAAADADATTADAHASAADTRGTTSDAPATAANTPAIAVEDRPTKAAAAAESGPDAADEPDDTELPRRSPAGGVNAIKRAAEVRPVSRPFARPAGPDATGEPATADAADEGFVHDLAAGDPTNDEAEPDPVPARGLPLPRIAASPAAVGAGTRGPAPSTRTEPLAPVTPSGPAAPPGPAEQPAESVRPTGKAEKAAESGETDSVPAPSGPAFPAAAPIEKRPMVLKPRRMPMAGFPPPDPPSRRVRSEPRPPQD